MAHRSPRPPSPRRFGFPRVVSPPRPQEPGLFEADVVSSQLRYSGILETIRIRKEGFPIRIPFLVFIVLGVLGVVAQSLSPWEGSVAVSPAGLWHGEVSLVVTVFWARPGTAAWWTCGPTWFPTGPTAWRC